MRIVLLKSLFFSPHSQDDCGATALHCAAANDHAFTCQFLLENGADIEAQNRRGQTPFHIAVRNRSRETARLLLRCGAETGKEDAGGNKDEEFQSGLLEMKNFLGI